jgi:hypothetical protein
VEISIRVDAGNALRHLTDIQNRIPRALEAGLLDAGKLVRREMMVYPPQRRGSSYRRTGTLKASWFLGNLQRVGNGVQLRVYSSGNMAPYNVFVQKAGMQAAVHRGRWPTEVAVATRLEPQIVRMVQARVMAALR